MLQKIYKLIFQRHLQKKQKIDVENYTSDDEDFHEESSEHHSFNESTIEINPKWTDLNVASVQTKEKSNQAVKSIPEIFASGQSEILRETCLEKTELTSDGDILNCLQAALTQSHSSNDRVQLVSVLCAKDKDNKYIYTIAELLKLFPDMSKHLIEKARIHAAGGQAGMPIEANDLLLKITAELKNNHRGTLNEFEIIEKQLRDGK